MWSTATGTPASTGRGPVRVGRDRHHPRPLEPAYLLGHRVGRLTRGEVHALRQGLVCEAQRVRGHVSIIDARAAPSATYQRGRAGGLRSLWEFLRNGRRWPGWARGDPALATHASQESTLGPRRSRRAGELAWPEDAIQPGAGVVLLSPPEVGPKAWAGTDGGNWTAAVCRGARPRSPPLRPRAPLRELGLDLLSAPGGSRAVLAHEPRPVTWRASPRAIAGNVSHE